MSDLIDRQAAIDALDCINGAEEVLRALPSVQPDHVADTGKKVADDDCISRQAAVDVVDFECGEWRGLAKTIIDKLEALSSAQPERKQTCKPMYADVSDTISRQAAIDAQEQESYLL